MIEQRTSLRIEGVATALTSIVHGGEHIGTQQVLRRERICQPDGTVADVPVVSGNAWRGILRDTSAQLLWDQLGRPELPLPVFHVLFSGGALAKAGSGHVLSNPDLQQIRTLVPHVALFGAAGGGRIIEGKLAVGKLVPVCTETAHIMPAGLAETAITSVWDLTQLEEFTRTDDAKRAEYQPALAGATGPALSAGGQGSIVAAASKTVSDDGPAQQMRYGTETIAAGTRFHFWLGLRNVTDLQHSWFLAAISEWSRTGHVGGRSATGHGRIRLDTDRWEVAGSRMSGDGTLAPSVADELRAHVESHRDDILAALDKLQ